MNTVLYRKGIRYYKKEYTKENGFEELVVMNSKTLFGNKSIYIDAKKKIDNNAFGGVIPDGFLFDLTDPQNPEFYIVEVELSRHNFFNHIFPQITKFFAFFKNPDSQGKLTEKLYEIFYKDDQLKRELRSKIGNSEIFKFLKDAIENSQNILIVIDNEKPEFPKIVETYTDTWGKMVRIAILKEYHQTNDKEDIILTMTPDFENIENIDIVSTEQDESAKPTNYTIDFHLDGMPENIKELFNELTSKLKESIPTITLNPQRYYISLRKKRNFAFLKIRKKKIAIIAMLKEEKIREKIKNYHIESLSQGVQNFYNGPCAKIDLTDKNNLKEILDLLVEIQK